MRVDLHCSLSGEWGEGRGVSSSELIMVQEIEWKKRIKEKLKLNKADNTLQPAPPSPLKNRGRGSRLSPDVNNEYIK